MNKRDIQVLKNMHKRLNKMIDKEKDAELLSNLYQANGYIYNILIEVNK